MSQIKTPDSLTRHWTDRLPDWLRPYASLARWDRPVGWQLLLLPCWMGVAVVRTQDGFFMEDARYAAAFALGAIAARGAGCTYNDIVDRKIDAQVARTRARPIPSGQVSVRAATAFIVLQIAAALAVLLVLPPPAQIGALAAVPLVAAYPFMKRITWWPQAWLGLTFSWGALVGALAVGTSLTPPTEALALYGACILWVIAYDTLYALQDREDDALIGVRSTARLFGAHWRRAVQLLYLLALFGWGLAAALAGAGWPTMIGLGAIGAALIWPLIEHAKDTAPETALAAFRQNTWVGLAVVIVLALEPLWRTLRPLLSP